MYRALMAIEPPLAPEELRDDLGRSGVQIVQEMTEPGDLAPAAIRLAPDLVITASASPSPALFDAARLLGTLAPCPFVLFTADRDAAKIVRATEADVHVYVVDGYASHRLPAIIELARARFRQSQISRDALRGLTQRFDERKIVDRAKGALMRSRGITEQEAFEALRNLAMRARQRLGVVAQSVLDRARAGEAMNRAGQLRMLSQRIAKCYAQILCGFETDAAARIMAGCVRRVGANMTILRRAIAAEGYGPLVEQVAASWVALEALIGSAPAAAVLPELDRRAEAMLRDAERLTDFLGSSGLVASLQILNVSGRQRMLSQRMSKLCFLLALEPDPARLIELRGMITGFQSVMTYLEGVPLTSPGIRASLDAATAEWARLRAVLDAIGDAAALRQVSDSSERLLDFTEGLTDQYEQAMQLLIGDRIGRLA